MSQTPFPLEFSVSGEPRSLQAKRRASVDRWKEKISDAIAERFIDLDSVTTFDSGPVCVTIYYFTGDDTLDTAPDLDNILKPILDAMCPKVYTDDRLVERIVVQRVGPGVEMEFSLRSELLTDVLDRERPVLYVRVDNDQSWRQSA